MGSKSISKGGKLVLLKTTAQKIPNFWMNLFLLPTKICNGIQRQMNSFWWGNGGSGKRIRWLVWDKLYNAKASGGLGFRELSKFNLAMLAKQGWRLLNNVNTLVTSIMKARYFPETDFLQAKVGANPSYMWRSIVAAQDLVRQGSRKRIGNGDTTTVWKIPWLSCRENGYLTTEMPQQLEHARVSSLMETYTKHWDDELLRDICNERDVMLIRSIPLAQQREEDSWYWVLEES
ncbi:putative mitochondrial protein AtMg00310 [Apium graveolens]|uniref:putative mitochondrial protein AtMg00310 n=1 Tax=Apium graveolens TaxID=4045 RepID=UPI003D7BB873